MNSFRESPKRKTRVTIIIGLICKDAIVLAGDSQTTREGMKRTDAQKITSIKFADRSVLIAQAGHAGTSARAIEMLRETATTTQITDYRMPAEMARSAMIQVKRELKEQYCNCTMSELQDLIRKDELQSELMLAYYFDSRPYIFTVDLAVARCDKETSWYSAIGCGANLGSYLLSEHTKRDMDKGLGFTLAVYIIETVCKHDAYCSSPAKVGLILNDLGASEKMKDPNSQTIHPSAFGLSLVIISTVNKLPRWSNKLEKIMQSEKERRNKTIERLLSKESDKVKKLWKDFIAKATPRTAEKLAKMFNESGISSFEGFKSQ